MVITNPASQTSAKLQVLSGYAWASAGVAGATLCFWLIRPFVDKGQASLLYLPVVLACAVRFGFGPAVLGAVGSFLCWDYFFLPPFGTFAVSDPKDWLSLVVFLLAAVVTAKLAAQASTQTRLARAREAEIGTLFLASETISREVRADRLLAALTAQLQSLCHATRCLVFRQDAAGGTLCLVPDGQPAPQPDTGAIAPIMRLAEAASAHDQVIGFGSSRHLWLKALAALENPNDHADGDMGIYVPLHASDALVGVLHVGPRDNGKPYSAQEQQLILTLANHAAVVIARDTLATQAAQAQALRDADTLKEALLSMVSHELKTPLAAIKASASGLLASDADWEDTVRVQALADINTQADRLSALVSNLLDLSRLEAGAWKPVRDWCDLADVVGTVLDQLPPEGADRVQANLSPDLMLVKADFVQISLVIFNLLENAVKYAASGSPICLSIQPAPGGKDGTPGGVAIQVRDFGAGISEGEAERVFERFYRGTRHTGGGTHGTGLGLALCRAIVQAHGGSIRAGNAPDGALRGAVFTVWLPLF